MTLIASFAIPVGTIAGLDEMTSSSAGPESRSAPPWIASTAWPPDCCADVTTTFQGVTWCLTPVVYTDMAALPSVP